METPKVYIGTYAKYSNGSLFGKWLDLSDYSNKDEFIEACKTLHNDESEPELMFQDWEGIPETYINESYISPDFWDYMEAIQNWDEDKIQAYGVYAKYFSADLEIFEDSYCGKWESEEDFARNIVDECYTLEGVLANYFDYEAFARDLFLGDYSYHEGFVFSA